MNIQRSHLQISTSLITGLLIGSFTFGSASAEETPIPIPQGQVLNVCVDKKTFAMRAVKTCKATEKAVLLGGTGPQGVQGATGATGEQGLTGAQGMQGERGLTGAQGIQGERGLIGAQGMQGERGLTGAAGSVSGLRQSIVTIWEPSSIGGFCSTFGYSALSYDTRVSSSGSLAKSCINFNSRNVTVYTP